MKMVDVTQVTSTCPWLNSQSLSESFTYDASDQLVSASETNSGSYQLAVTYGNWGKINSYNLTQTDLQSNTSQSESQSYTYPATNSIGSSQTLFAPVSRTIQGGQHPHSVQSFTFGINGSLRKREVFGVATYTEHYLFNSQANLKAYSNNLTDFAYYGYNASNTRTYKLGFLGGSQWVNGQPEPLSLQFQQAMFYPNAYINFNHNGEYTKHYYNGAERIASRLGNTRRTIVTGANSRLQARAAQMDELFKGQIIEMLPYEEPASAIPDPNNGGGLSDPLYPTVEYYPIPTFTELQITGNTTDIFYYHTNHLGSTAFVTNQSRNVTQGFLYAPFGEITTEYNATFGNDIIPKYSFNAKELDEETGMYYYEARYYKPPVFTSRDPMFEKYFWMTPYAYCANNPVKYVDPDGEKIWIICEDGSEIEYTPGMQYEGKSVFQKQTIEALNYGYDNSPTAKKMISELCEPKFEYKIKGGDDSEYKPSNSAVVQKYGSDEKFYKKGGGTIIWNTQGENLFERDPKSGLSTLVRRPTIGLLHELGHAWDHMEGLLAAEDMKFENLKVSEWTATRTENMIRKELKLPLRTYYEVGKWEGKNHPEGPRLLDSEGNHRYTKYQHP